MLCLGINKKKNIGSRATYAQNPIFSNEIIFPYAITLVES